MDSKLTRIKELIELLNEASHAYYAEDRELMSNLEYDRLYEELEKLEAETGMVFANSPTENVGYEAVEELPKERHEKPMLSLGKTKSREELIQWVGDKEALLSWKLDGLTIVLTYTEGKLVKAVTRGNGEVGEVVTNNARTFKNLPLTIPYKGELILRGEAVITYSDFEKMNQEITLEEDRYKNPRNLCSGSVRQLNNEITDKRNVQFWAFALVKAEDVNFDNSREKQFLFLKEQGFDVVEYRRTDGSKMLEDIAYFEKKIEHYDIPSDGLVLVYDDVAYGTALGTTAKFPRDAIAFKWADEQKETILTEIEWSPSRTGLINPVAIFEPVELEGTTVSRASVHNISIMQNMKLGIGDKIMVYKANMIIPQIAENLTESNHIEIPKACPVCGMPTEIKMINDVKWLYCVNDECAAKKIKAFTLFVSRDAMNIDGLSEATLEKFINRGYIHEFADLFHLDKYQNEIEQMEGFGAKSFRNLADSIEKARHTTLPKVIYGLGIANIGLATAKILCRHFNYDMEQMKQADVTEISEIEGIGEVIATAFYQYLSKEEHKQSMERLWKELDIEIPVLDESSMTLAGKTFVITGSLNRFANRNELKELIESRGGKVTGSVTGKTDCLINNDNMSGSSKNKKAKELQVPVLTEEEFMVLYIR